MPPLAVEARNAAAQLVDGLHQIVALPDQGFELFGDLHRLFVGAEIDATQPLAVLAKADEFFLDVFGRRNLLGFEASGSHNLIRLALQNFADAALAGLVPLLRGFEVGIVPGMVFA